MTRRRGAMMAQCLTLMLIGAGAPPAAAQTENASPPPASGAPPADTVMLHRSATVLGQVVKSQDGKATGRIVDVLVNHLGEPRAAVIDFGGFLGLGTRRIAVDWSRMRFATGGTGQATVDLTLEQLQAAPDYKDTTGPVPVLAPPPAPAASRPASPSP